MYKTIPIIVMAVLCLHFSLMAQNQIKLSGTVTDRLHQPLAGVTIKIKNSNIIASTNSNGNFFINSNVKEGTIQFSFLGYKTTEIIFTGNSPNLIIQLTEDQNELNEIQIIGYGKTTRRLSTGSIATIGAKQLEQQPVTNVLSALSGRMPGVFVQTTNGLPGGNINIQIRGKGSVAAGTNPLYIVDDVPYEGAAPHASTSPLSLDNIAGMISPLNSISPADITTITVLKDADATSIYGSRGANGVVLITTKKATAGNTKLNINVQHGVSKIANNPDILNLADYLLMRREAFATDGLTPSVDPNSTAYAPDLMVWSQTRATDWVDYIFGNTAKSTNAQARISGGMASTTFSVSGNLYSENTVMIGKNNFTRAGLHSQFFHKSGNNKFNISLSNQINRQSADMVNPVQNLAAIILLAPNYPLYLPDGSFNWYAGTNIDAEVNARSKSKTNNSITSLVLNYKVLHDLNLKLRAGYTKTDYDQAQVFPKRAISPYLINYSNFGNSSSESYIVEPQADYALKGKKATLSFLLGTTFQNRSSNNQFIRASNFKLESLMEDLGSAGTINSRTNSSLQYKYFSAFGRASYNLMDTYLLNATLRWDGSSRFGPGNRFGTFGSVGVAWIFSNMLFFKDKMSFLSYGKLRGSYGTTGNDQIPDYGYLSTYNSSGINYQGIGTLKPSRISNADFHWETTRKIDMAIELGFLNDQILLNLDYFINKSVDQLVNYTLPQTTAFNSYQANLPAVIENKGWELALTAKVIDQDRFSWLSTFNITLAKNKLKSFENFAASSYANQFELGYDITRIYGYKYLGADPNTGMPQYADKNGEPSTNPYLFNTLGKLSPDYYGGLSNVFRYRSLELNVFAQFVKQTGKGELQYNPGVFVYNHYNFVKDRWSTSNTSSNVPRATANGFDPYYSNSSLNIFDTSYLRLKNVSLSYSFPARLAKKFKLENLKMYAQGQNLLTLRHRNIAVIDPESGALASPLSRNVPPLKTIVFGIQFTL